MRDIAVVSFAQVPAVSSGVSRDDVEMVSEVVLGATVRANIPKDRIGFTCSASCDFLGGRPFSFVGA
ncbi:MAG: hypothetical protein KDA28_02275, partial [Phycisphaerales bacterium]|nr:hypothetical protein [Phycisphaerales bacterium]